MIEHIKMPKLEIQLQKSVSTFLLLQIENSLESTRSTEEEEKEQTLHYGEIQFLKRSPEPSNCRVELDTVYSQVKVSEPASRLRQMADDPECLYAQVRC